MCPYHCDFGAASRRLQVTSAQLSGLTKERAGRYYLGSCANTSIWNIRHCFYFTHKLRKIEGFGILVFVLNCFKMVYTHFQIQKIPAEITYKKARQGTQMNSLNN